MDYMLLVTLVTLAVRLSLVLLFSALLASNSPQLPLLFSLLTTSQLTVFVHVVFLIILFVLPCPVLPVLLPAPFDKKACDHHRMSSIKSYEMLPSTAQASV